MENPKQIEHQGIIKDICGNNIKVSIIAKSACVSCSLNKSCSVSDIEEKIIDVRVHQPEQYQCGERINVFYKKTLGYRALLLGYLLPFLILMFVLISAMSFTHNEGAAGIIALASLIPYYFILHFSKDKIRKTFTFSIEKINNTLTYSSATI